ncbi:MAG: type II toxin-antitoxin system prevent-host-death family antitoxin [Rhodocyclaceae bacterium]|nr:type II toxin-antitoxin system prevent-host-death family antitoxin [Rhodocyclaceae bacterium]
MTAKRETLETLPRTPASDIKKLGWRGVLEVVQREGQVVVTNHNRPEAVIVSAAEYERLLQARQDGEARKRLALEELSREWDKRLACFNEPGAGDKLRAALRKPLQLHGQVRAGEH